MNKTQLVDALAKDTGMAKAEVSRVLESLIGTSTRR